jgi:hypothetical protein
LGKWAARLAEKTTTPDYGGTDKTDKRGVLSVLAVTPQGGPRRLQASPVSRSGEVEIPEAPLGAEPSTTAGGHYRVLAPPVSEPTGAMRAARTEVLALLGSPLRPHRLSRADADRAHAESWDDETCERYVKRVSIFLRRGMNVTDADDFAERLHLRDLEGDDRRCCMECRHYGRGRCAAHGLAGLSEPDISPDIVCLLQRCPAADDRI